MSTATIEPVTLTKTADERFVSPENAWLHEALDVLDKVFGVTDTIVDTDENDSLVCHVLLDPAH